MKREFLKKLLGDSATDEMITAILNENMADQKPHIDKIGLLEGQVKNLTDTITNRDEQLEQLKNSPDNPETLKATITTLQSQNQTDKQNHETEINSLKMNMAIGKALGGAKAKNEIAVKALLADYLEDAELEEKNGEYVIKGLDKQIEKLQKDETSSFLFDLENKPADPTFKGLKPGESGYKTTDPQTKPKNQWSYDDFVKAESQQ